MPAVYSKNPDVVFRNIAGECVLVPIRNRVADMECIFSLNETASRVWELIDGQRTMEAIKGELLSEFDIGAEALGEDLAALTDELEQLKLIKSNG